MEHSDIILKILEERGVTFYKISKDTKISDSLFSKWKEKPTSKISSSNVVKIATYLGVSVDYLLGNEKQPTQMGELSEDEVALLDAFRALNQEGQEKLVDYASDLVALGKYKKCNSAELGA